MTTKIEWTNETWNPITGCSKIGDECRNCYAERMAKRFGGRNGYPAKNPFQPGVLHPTALSKPSRWTDSHCFVFVSSMGDLFHEEVRFEDLDIVMDIICRYSQHTFQLLTKRPHQMKKYFQGRQAAGKRMPQNIWIGVTVGCDTPKAMERLEILSDEFFEQWIRFVSAEPLLSELDIRKHLSWLDWVICGGETGPDARACSVDWVKRLRDQCLAARVPFFFKKFMNGKRTVEGQIWEQWPEPR